MNGRKCERVNDNVDVSRSAAIGSATYLSHGLQNCEPTGGPGHPAFISQWSRGGRTPWELGSIVANDSEEPNPMHQASARLSLSGVERQKTPAASSCAIHCGKGALSRLQQISDRAVMYPPLLVLTGQLLRALWPCNAVLIPTLALTSSAV